MANKGIALLLELIKKGPADKVKAVILNTTPRSSLSEPGIEGGEVPLIVAASLGKTGIVEDLLDAGANLTFARETGTNVTPLMYASMQGNLGMTKILTDFARKTSDNATLKSFIDAQSFQGLSALMFACGKGHFDVAKHLICDCNADANLKAYDGSTALMAAAQVNNSDLTRLLLEDGKADSNVATTADAFTALMMTSDLGVVKLLLDIGQADINFQSVKGATALSSACTRGRLDLAKYLIEEKGADIFLKSKFDNSDAMTSSVISGNLELVIYMANLYVECNKVFANDTLLNGTTLLMLSSNPKVSAFLIENGADVNQTAKSDNSTALMAAAIKGNSEMTKILLDAGAKASILTVSGQNALSMSFAYGRCATTFNLILAKWKEEQKVSRPVNGFFSSLKLEAECMFLTIVAAVLRFFPAPPLK